MPELLGSYLVSALGTLGVLAIPRRSRGVLTGMVLALSGSIALFAAVSVLVHGRAIHVSSASGLALSGVHLTLDPLGAWFLAVVAAVSVPAGVFHAGYAHAAMTSRPASVLMVLFSASLSLVPVAGDVPTFFLAWELMALTSLGLLLVEHSRASARRAALWYAAMTQAGASSILLGMLLGAHVTHTTRIVGVSPAGAGVVGALAFVFSAAGFASKAGAVPLHVWLPRAHPEASTPVSAMMSGAMVALGLYGVVRVDVIELAHAGRGLFIALIVMGALSALFGALHAAAATDLKRLLAFSTIDVSGLVLVGLGAAGLMARVGAPASARALLAAVLVLVAAHAAFKSLLFLASGLIERATGTRDLDLLGGTARSMPVTSLLLGLGAASAMGVPLLGGFVGEWLSLESLIGGLAHRDVSSVLALLLGLVAVALAGGLAVVTFTKLIGVGLLGRARSAGVASAHEVGGLTRVSLVALGVVNVVVGVVPGLLATPLDRVSRFIGGPGALGGSWSSFGLATSASALRPLQLAGLLVAVTLLLGLLARPRAVRRSPAWGCGRSESSARMQYTATSFAEPVQRVFADVLRPDVDVAVSHEDESREVERVLAYQGTVEDALERSFYRGLLRGADRLGERARALANGSVHRYLAYGFLTLLVVLVVVR